jgi:hypothetical protein
MVFFCPAATPGARVANLAAGAVSDAKGSSAETWPEGVIFGALLACGTRFRG